MKGQKKCQISVVNEVIRIISGIKKQQINSEETRAMALMQNGRS